jgi:ABC-type multidrug transport system fused ATPase/permease subunit
MSPRTTASSVDLLEEGRDLKAEAKDRKDTFDLKAECKGVRPPEASSPSPPSSALAVCVSVFRRTYLWTLGVGVAIVVSQAMEPLGMTLLSQWVDGAFVLAPGPFFGLFTALLVGRVLTQHLVGLFKSIGNANLAADIRHTSDQTLVDLSMQYFWCGGGTTTDVFSAVTANPDAYTDNIAQLPILLVHTVYRLSAVVFALPHLLVVVVAMAFVYPHTGFAVKWLHRFVTPGIHDNNARSLLLASNEHECILAIRSLQRQDVFDEAASKLAMQKIYLEFMKWCGYKFKHSLNLSIDLVFAVCAMMAVVAIKQRGGTVVEAVVVHKLVTRLANSLQQLQSTLEAVERSLGEHRKVDRFVCTSYVEELAESGNCTLPSEVAAFTSHDLEQKPYKTLQALAKETVACKANLAKAEMVVRLSAYYASRVWTRKWPVSGAIRFSNTKFAYSPTAPVALQLDRLDIASGEKVGIVGPPGAGKSTFVNLLFRLGPLTGGSIWIDNVDISTLSLDFLRGSIAIVPQEPTIFRGTLLENLGGAAVTSKDALAVLGAFGFVASEESLHAQVSDSLSLGQKQIVAAGRALLRQPKVFRFYYFV